MNFETILLAAVVVVVLVLLYYLVYNSESAMEMHLNKRTKLLRQEIDDIEDSPDYDLPTYEGKALRNRWESIHKELDILARIIN